MKTIGFRLTLLYVCAVAGVIMAIFLLGEYLLAQQIRKGLDGMLALRFSELRSRLTADPIRSSLDLAVLLPGQSVATPFYVQVQDRWDDPSFREARMRGEPLPVTLANRFFDDFWTTGETVRVVEGVSESLKLRIATPLAPLSKAISSYNRAGLAVFAVVFGLSLLAGSLLSRAALRPVRTIQQTAARIRSDNLSERIPVGAAQDEISSLALLLNQTFDRLELSFEQINRFSADVSHEIKTPLTLIRLNVERLLGEQDLTPGGREALQDAIEEIHSLDKLIERLLFLSRAQAGEVELDRQEHNSREFIDAFLHDGQALAEPQGMICQVLRNDGGLVRFDSGRMRQVLFNLLANALQVSSTGGRISLSSTVRDGLWRVTVDDEGEGLAADKCEVIFERFVRIDQSTGTEAAGLGLAICRSIVELHHGKIFARPRTDGRGLRIVLEIPVTT